MFGSAENGNDYIRFLVATNSDPALRRALRLAAAEVRTADDLARFAESHGYRFARDDVPLSDAGRCAISSLDGAGPAERRHRAALTLNHK